MPKLLHVGVHDGENDCSLYEVLLELAPGLVIATRCGLPEDFASDMTDEGLKAVETEAQESVVEYADRAVQACMLQLDRLADILHQARLDTRGVLAEWNRGGVQARLVDVRLAPFDHWRGVTEPALVILLEAPGERLTPETHQSREFLSVSSSECCIAVESGQTDSRPRSTTIAPGMEVASSNIHASDTSERRDSVSG